jgi:protein-S-isoprenylcysteine O-methyltransferase Ste14
VGTIRVEITLDHRKSLMPANALHRLWFGPFTFSLPRSMLGIAIIFASFILVAWCVKLFKKAGTPYRPVSPATAIVSSGPYRFSRNPIYVGIRRRSSGAVG